MEADRLHYITVRVSENRYAVAEWAGLGLQNDHHIVGFVIVSNSMKYQEAKQLAHDLTHQRLLDLIL